MSSLAPSPAGMTVPQFQQKWRGLALKERTLTNL